MALVKYDDGHVQSKWNARDKKSTQYKIPGDVERPVIDYDKLKALCDITGLYDTSGNDSTSDAHKQFMNQYHSVFVQPQKKSLPKYLENKKSMKASVLSIESSSTANSKSVVAGESTLAHKPPTKPKTEESEPSHDVRDHMAKLHKQRKNEDPKALTAARIKTLRKILRKLPFERTAQEAEQVYNAVKHFSGISDQMEGHVLKELCVVAQVDIWKDDDITVFGNSGLHMVLKGSVRPTHQQYMQPCWSKLEFESPSPEPEHDLPLLGVGECFGTLTKVQGRDANSRILTVTTVEENCEFMKISTSDYKRVMEQIRLREQAEKLNLMQSCQTYKMWSKQPLLKVADLFKWVKFTPNTVLISEGYQSPFIGIVKSGECHVLKQVEAWHQLGNGQKEKRLKQVVMGKLGAGESFGEISIINKEPMTCSIITASNVELACIDPAKLHVLDEVTVQLLQQSGQNTFADLSQDDIHDEFVSQEMKREWNEYKHKVVVSVINNKGIRPGYGKWSKD